MMLNNKKSNSKSMFKLLALLPIVGIALALNAETVTDYVYEQPQKKGCLEKKLSNYHVHN